jgi:hypothetical protein
MAYRLVARDTVEERILSLQQTKRELAESILAGEESLIRTLSREDLELLLDSKQRDAATSASDISTTQPPLEGGSTARRLITPPLAARCGLPCKKYRPTSP